MAMFAWRSVSCLDDLAQAGRYVGKYCRMNAPPMGQSRFEMRALTFLVSWRTFLNTKPFWMAKVRLLRKAPLLLPLTLCGSHDEHAMSSQRPFSGHRRERRLRPR